jgi:hypothetical protein
MIIALEKSDRAAAEKLKNQLLGGMTYTDRGRKNPLQDSRTSSRAIST